MAKSACVNLRVDSELARAVACYSAAAGHLSMSQTYRELIECGLLCKTERGWASVIRQQVREEVDAFLEDVGARMALLADDMAATLEESLDEKLAANELLAHAALVAASEAAAAAGTADNTNDVISRAMSAALSSRYDPGVLL